jgi:tRNA pseudouridine38-40 synthase
MLRNIRLTLAYDGTDFGGWQIQPNRPTVQEAVEKAIHALSGEHVTLLSSGRTDAGVHALGQVASFFTESPIPPENWWSALRAHLPESIIVLESGEAGPKFHATYSAISKRYRYVILNSRVDDPFLRRFTWRVGSQLDAAAMHRAAQSLVGTHDFRCFESNWPNTSTSVRTLYDVRVFRTGTWAMWRPSATEAQPRPPENDSQPLVCIEISGDGFLYNMVRAIAGSLVPIGRGFWPETAIAELISGQKRSRAGETAPAQGLYLVSVEYPESIDAPQMRNSDDGNQRS